MIALAAFVALVQFAEARQYLYFCTDKASKLSTCWR
jgi:hypothetical protein